MNLVRLFPVTPLGLLWYLYNYYYTRNRGKGQAFSLNSFKIFSIVIFFFTILLYSLPYLIFSSLDHWAIVFIFPLCSIFILFLLLFCCVCRSTQRQLLGS